MKNRAMLFGLIGVLALASCRMSRKESPSLFSSSPLSSEEPIPCPVYPNNSSVEENAKGNFVMSLFVFRTSCGEIRCFPSYFESGNSQKDLLEIEGNGVAVKNEAGKVEFISYTLGEMKEFLKIGFKGRQNISLFDVYEIPENITPEECRELLKNPYPYVCKDKSIYDTLGIDNAYNYAKTMGYLDFPDPAVLTSPNLTFAYLKEHDAFFLGKYIVAFTGTENFVFEMDKTFKCVARSSNLTIDHEKAKEAVGLNFVDLVKRFGCPTYIASKGANTKIDYITDRRGTRFTLDENYSVSGVERAPHYDLLGKGNSKVPVSFIDDVKTYTPFSKIVEKYGFPQGMTGSGTTYYVYYLEDGRYVTLRLSIGLVEYYVGNRGDTVVSVYLH